jgi:protein involved in polysaccharide export with SLBB domain
MKTLRYFLFLVAFCSFTVVAKAQQIQDVQNLDINSISDEQFSQVVTKYQLGGLSDTEIDQVGRQKGLNFEQIAALKKRILAMDPFAAGAAGSKSKVKDDNVEERKKIAIKVPSRKNISNPNEYLVVFGSEVFENYNLSFEPNLTIASPKNYVIGALDELLIDIYGLSESSKKLKVSQDGFIRFPNLGPIKVAGLTIEEAQVKIKAAAAKVYTTIATGNTDVNVSLGQLRSIKVTLIGEVQKPGNYTLSSLSTLMNALYASGGPNDLGTFRKIELVRSGKTIVLFDLYDFLVKGDLSKNKLLQDQDVIRVGTYETRVAVLGASKKNALFDVKKGETAQDILNYAGGFSDIGYKEMVRIKRMGIKGKEVLSVKASLLSNTILNSGDTLLVDYLPEQYMNRVSVEGAVYYPGEYGIQQMGNLKSLLQAVQVKENAYYDRAIIRRMNADMTPSILHFNVNEVLAGQSNINLQREDSVYIYTKENIREKYSVTINGEVNQPNAYEYADSMRVQDLILIAGGFRDGASLQRLEISRRIRKTSSDNDTSAYAIVKAIDLSANNASDLNFTLAPFDIVSVRKSPNYKEQITVSVEGEVLYPGKYSLTGTKERLSDIIIRAGGIKQTGFSTGAILIRKTRINQTEADAALFSSKLTTIANKTNSSTGSNISTSDTAQIKTAVSSLNDTQKPVGIRLESALAHPGSIDDLILEEGDILKVPKLLQTVQTFGAVNVPKQIAFREGLSFKQLIRASGWFASNASKRNSYLVRPNGEIKSTKHFFFMNFYPRIKAGSEVYVPAKKQGRPISTAEYIGIGSSVASLAGLIIALINATK